MCAINLPSHSTALPVGVTAYHIPAREAADLEADPTRVARCLAVRLRRFMPYQFGIFAIEVTRVHKPELSFDGPIYTNPTAS